MVKDKKTLYRKITRLQGYEPVEAEDSIVVERPLTIYLNGRELVTLLCTPTASDYLAIGFLRSEGLLRDYSELVSLRVFEDDGRVEVELSRDYDLLPEELYGKRTITSGCGKGTVFFNVLDSLRSRPNRGRLKIEVSTIRSMVRDLQERAQLFRETGGVHSAALGSADGLVLFSEDIGRHNAVDKLIGECMVRKIPTDDKVLVLSGRISAEILLKAAKLDIQVIISRAAPTSLSLELADHLNITVVGFVRGERMNIYTHCWRIKVEEPRN